MLLDASRITAINRNGTRIDYVFRDTTGAEHRDNLVLSGPDREGLFGLISNRIIEPNDNPIHSVLPALAMRCKVGDVVTVSQ